MATTKITDLTAYTDPVNTDVLPIVDVTSDVTKKVSIANVMKNASLGTAALPGIAFDGDPNTGIYSPGADQVAISTNGTGRLFVDSSGNIKVSTGEIFQTSAASYIRVDGGSGSGTGANIIVFGESHASASGRISLSAVGTGAIISSTAGAERMRLTSTGALNFVGAGTAGVTQAVSFNGSAPVNSLVIDSSGRVGLGTSSPATLLHLNSATGTSTTLAYSENNVLKWYNRYNVSDGSFQIVDVVNTATRLHIANTGNVGIGTTSPNNKLEIAGTTANVGLDGTSNTYINFLKSAANIGYAGDANWMFGGSSSDFGLRATSNLVFGIGANEAARIDGSRRLLVGTSQSTGAGELLRVEKASTGNEGAGIRLAGTFSLVNDGTQTISVGNGCLVFVSENTTGDGGLFFCGYRSATVTLISDPNNRYANAVTAGRISLTKSANSGTATVTNKGGSSYTFTVGKINCSD